MSTESQPSILSRLRDRASLRLVFFVVSGVLGGWGLVSIAPGALNWLYKMASKEEAYPAATAPASLLPFAILGALLGAFACGLLMAWGSKLAYKWERMEIGDKVNVFVGVFGGFVLALPFLLIYQSLKLADVYIPLILFGLTVGFAALAIYALESMEEILPWTRGRAKGKRRGIKILDTNVIIDGRVYDVARCGFLEGQLYVPQFVLEELQHIADSHDGLRRQRGRRGLEVLRHMQAEFPMEVGIHDRLAPEQGDEVDARLVRLARALGADIVTNDWNLNNVAKLQDVVVLNLNDLTLSLRPNVLPKERLCLTLIREGNQPGQGVGYLEDGTMVVVENGKPHVGETLEVSVTQVIQTERGKMIFGEVPGDEPETGGWPDQSPRKPANGPRPRR